MKRRLNLKRLESIMDNPVPASCGCLNHNGGEITFCKLHAAAHELLEAAKNFVWGGNHIVLAHRERLLNAIAKAEGRE